MLCDYSTIHAQVNKFNTLMSGFRKFIQSLDIWHFGIILMISQYQDT